jgi:hypothetical protein
MFILTENITLFMEAIVYFNIVNITDIVRSNLDQGEVFNIMW